MKAKVTWFLTIRQREVRELIASEFHGDVQTETVLAIDDLIEKEVERRYGGRMQRMDRLFKSFMIVALIGIAAVVVRHLGAVIVCSN